MDLFVTESNGHLFEVDVRPTDLQRHTENHNFEQIDEIALPPIAGLFFTKQHKSRRFKVFVFI